MSLNFTLKLSLVNLFKISSLAHSATLLLFFFVLSDALNQNFIGFYSGNLPVPKEYLLSYDETTRPVMASNTEFQNDSFVIDFTSSEPFELKMKTIPALTWPVDARKAGNGFIFALRWSRCSTEPQLVSLKFNISSAIPIVYHPPVWAQPIPSLCDHYYGLGTQGSIVPWNGRSLLLLRCRPRMTKGPPLDSPNSYLYSMSFLYRVIDPVLGVVIATSKLTVEETHECDDDGVNCKGNIAGRILPPPTEDIQLRMRYETDKTHFLKVVTTSYCEKAFFCRGYSLYGMAVADAVSPIVWIQKWEKTKHMMAFAHIIVQKTGFTTRHEYAAVVTVDRIQLYDIITGVLEFEEVFDKSICSENSNNFSDQCGILQMTSYFSPQSKSTMIYFLVVMRDMTLGYGNNNLIRMYKYQVIVDSSGQVSIQFKTRGDYSLNLEGEHIIDYYFVRAVDIDFFTSMVSPSVGNSSQIVLFQVKIITYWDHGSSDAASGYLFGFDADNSEHLWTIGQVYMNYLKDALLIPVRWLDNSEASALLLAGNLVVDLTGRQKQRNPSYFNIKQPTYPDYRWNRETFGEMDQNEDDLFGNEIDYSFVPHPFVTLVSNNQSLAFASYQGRNYDIDQNRENENFFGYYTAHVIYSLSHPPSGGGEEPSSIWSILLLICTILYGIISIVLTLKVVREGSSLAMIKLLGVIFYILCSLEGFSSYTSASTAISKLKSAWEDGSLRSFKDKYLKDCVGTGHKTTVTLANCAGESKRAPTSPSSVTMNDLCVCHDQNLGIPESQCDAKKLGCGLHEVEMASHSCSYLINDMCKCDYSFYEINLQCTCWMDPIDCHIAASKNQTTIPRESTHRRFNNCIDVYVSAENMNETVFLWMLVLLILSIFFDVISIVLLMKKGVEYSSRYVKKDSRFDKFCEYFFLFFTLAKAVFSITLLVRYESMKPTETVCTNPSGFLSFPGCELSEEIVDLEQKVVDILSKSLIVWASSVAMIITRFVLGTLFSCISGHRSVNISVNSFHRLY